MAASKHAFLQPWGVIADNVSMLRNNDPTIDGTKDFELNSSTSSSLVDFSIESKIHLADEAPTLENENHPHPLKIIIMGGPASGKGTQCERIAAEYGVVHLSTGDMLREAVRQDSETGKIAKIYIDAGELVPDEIMIKIVTERISQSDCQERGWLLDGFPRTPAQAEGMKISADLFIFLKVPDSELMERVVGRRLDPTTGKIYHIKYFPPPEDIQERLEQRSDDTKEKMTNRLRQFHKNVHAVRSYYEDILTEIDGTGSPDDITQRIIQAINSKRRRVEM
jgi:adenylate kinase